MTDETDSVEFSLDRSAALPELVGDHREFLVISGLGGASRDMGAITEGEPNLYAINGAMGAASMTGLGLALARPDRKVLVVTGDGELLMNVGALATIAVLDPPNLSIVCVDNGHYGETGFQLSHTGRGVDLEQIARGAGIARTCTVQTEADLGRGAEVVHDFGGTSFVLLRVSGKDPAPLRRDLDGAAQRVRFRDALLGPP